ncbi:DUF2188 domain-containing protein [Cupriavidus sp. M-11]|uniref:DUF2188 domain-containing protein n=1 Tax=Cupriavidus sp. M-11 TaxID=3233038 RepID=UPI003F8DAC85
MPGNSNFHVLPYGDGWAIKREGSIGIRSRHDSQADAITAGVQLAAQEAVELLVHDRDGQICTTSRQH